MRYFRTGWSPSMWWRILRLMERTLFYRMWKFALQQICTEAGACLGIVWKLEGTNLKVVDDYFARMLVTMLKWLMLHFLHWRYYVRSRGIRAWIWKVWLDCLYYWQILLLSGSQLWEVRMEVSSHEVPLSCHVHCTLRCCNHVVSLTFQYFVVFAALPQTCEFEVWIRACRKWTVRLECLYYWQFLLLSGR